jgi:peroxiredoxin
MNSSPPPSSGISSPPPTRGSGLAIASLALGILAFVSGVVLVGAVFGVIGFILGLVQLARRGGGRGLAVAGIILSVLGIGLSVFVTVKLAPLARRGYTEARRAINSAMADASFAAWQGVAAPDIKVTTLGGQTVQLSELKGKRVVLDFWATWCGPCVKEIPHFIKLRNEVSSDELVIVGISSEDTATLNAFVKKHGVNYLIASADDLPAPYKDVQSIPTTFFIDRNGVIQQVLVGYHEFDDLKRHASAKDFEGDAKPAPSSAGANQSATGTNAIP